VQITFSYVLPLIALTLAFLELIPWKGKVAVVLVFILSPLTLVTTAFMMKRSLMLGATNEAIYFPGVIPDDDSYYNQERDLLEEIGISSHEFPLDILLVIVNSLVACLFWIFQPSEQETQSQQILIQTLIQTLIITLLAVFAFLRRKRLRRW
jgi:hypothetical protein